MPQQYECEKVGKHKMTVLDFDKFIKRKAGSDWYWQAATYSFVTIVRLRSTRLSIHIS
jgi:hypothetical protein